MLASAGVPAQRDDVLYCSIINDISTRIRDGEKPGLIHLGGKTITIAARDLRLGRRGLPGDQTR